MIRIAFIIISLGVFCFGDEDKQPVAQEKPITLTRAEMVAAAEALMPIWTVACGDDRHEKEFGPEKMARLLEPVLAEVYPLTAIQRLALNLNKPIRDHDQYIKRVNDLPEAKWGKKSKKLLLGWFAVEGRKEGDKEAMLVLLILFEPRDKQ